MRVESFFISLNSKDPRSTAEDSTPRAFTVLRPPTCSVTWCAVSRKIATRSRESACTRFVKGRRLINTIIPSPSVVSVIGAEIEKATTRYIRRLVATVIEPLIFNRRLMDAGASIMSAVSRLPSFSRRRYGHEALRTFLNNVERVRRSYSVAMPICM